MSPYKQSENSEIPLTIDNKRTRIILIGKFIMVKIITIRELKIISCNTITLEKNKHILSITRTPVIFQKPIEG